MKYVAFIFRTLLYDVWRAIPQLIALVRRHIEKCKRQGDQSERDRRAAKTPCVPIDRPEFVRPDPLIYSQSYIKSLGLAVTWNNPDIVLRLNGVPVSSSLLQPDTVYQIVARIWNGSMVAPVVAMPVHFSYLDFGMGTVNVPIDTTAINLGVIGGPNQPAFATVLWRTPKVPGHYCIRVQLDPADDLNHLNNIGFENTMVGTAHSPVIFNFTLGNDTKRDRRYRFEVDAYTLGNLDLCDPNADDPATRRKRLERHRHGRHPLPAGWSVSINPETPTLAPEAVVVVTVEVTPSTGFVGAQPINVNAFHDGGFAGGVTLTVVGV